jgi:hypothetical protein
MECVGHVRDWVGYRPRVLERTSVNRSESVQTESHPDSCPNDVTTEYNIVHFYTVHPDATALDVRKETSAHHHTWETRGR